MTVEQITQGINDFLVTSGLMPFMIAGLVISIAAKAVSSLMGWGKHRDDEEDYEG